MLTGPSDNAAIELSDDSRLLDSVRTSAYHERQVFRVGKVYFLPEFGDGGMVARLNGEVIAIFEVPT